MLTFLTQTEDKFTSSLTNGKFTFCFCQTDIFNSTGAYKVMNGTLGACCKTLRKSSYKYRSEINFTQYLERKYFPLSVLNKMFKKMFFYGLKNNKLLTTRQNNNTIKKNNKICKPNILVRVTLFSQVLK